MTRLLGGASVETVALRPGYRISRLVRGGWQLAGDHGPVESERAVADMTAFVDAGIATFDCADIYTGVEEMIGAFLARLAAARGAARAAAVKVHTKYVPDLVTLGRLDRAAVEKVIDRSLARLGRERLDLVQLHWWDYAVPGAAECAQHLAGLQAQGKIDRIGVTNFDHRRLAGIIASGVDVVSAQVQYSLLDRRPEGGFLDWARANDVAVLAYGSLAGGFLTDRWLGEPDPGFAFDNRSLVKYRLIIEEFGGWNLFQDLLRVLRAIADRRGVDIAAVAVRAMLDTPGVAAVILGARYADRLRDTLRVFSIVLDEDDRRAIGAVQAGACGPTGPVYGLERDRHGPHGRIMKYGLQQAAGDGGLADSHGQQATGDGGLADSHGQQATGDGGLADSHGQQATGDGGPADSHGQQAAGACGPAGSHGQQAAGDGGSSGSHGTPG